MQCEVCGKESSKIVVARIEGALLNVCPECAKLGVIVAERAPTKSKVPSRDPGQAAMMRGLEMRKKRMTEKDIYDSSEKELVLDYADRVKSARNKFGLTRSDLAKKINEKESVLAEIERGELIPDNKLISKLEKTLNIKLMEVIERKSVSSDNDSKGEGVTLGDLININK